MPYKENIAGGSIYEVDDGDNLLRFVSEKTARDKFNELKEMLDKPIPNIIEGGEESLYQPDYLSLIKLTYLESEERINDVGSDS